LSHWLPAWTPSANRVRLGWVDIVEETIPELLVRSLGGIVDRSHQFSGRDDLTQSSGKGRRGHHVREKASTIHTFSLQNPMGLEQFSNSCALFSFVRGGFFSRKKPLVILLPVYINWRTAVAGVVRL
jgi:hypothetical protein